MSWESHQGHNGLSSDYRYNACAIIKLQTISSSPPDLSFSELIAPLNHNLAASFTDNSALAAA
jgi:hypothetical protein